MSVPDVPITIPVPRGGIRTPTRTEPPRPSYSDDQVELGEARECRALLHDVGHGLATLSLLLEAAREGAPTPVNQLFELIEQETARLLAFVHSDSCHAPSAEPVSVRGVLDQIVVLAELSRSTSVTLLAGVDVHLHTDAALLWRVVANVIDNAVRAAGSNGSVEVSAIRERDVIIEVVDDGPGFRRGPPGKANLGLDIVKRSLSACGGRLEVHGVQPRGTRVRVVLPDRPVIAPPGRRPQPGSAASV